MRAASKATVLACAARGLRLTDAVHHVDVAVTQCGSSAIDIRLEREGRCRGCTVVLRRRRERLRRRVQVVVHGSTVLLLLRCLRMLHEGLRLLRGGLRHEGLRSRRRVPRATSRQWLSMMSRLLL